MLEKRYLKLNGSLLRASADHWRLQWSALKILEQLFRFHSKGGIFSSPRRDSPACRHGVHPRDLYIREDDLA